MVSRRVIVYAMHEDEVVAAHRALTNVTETESYVLGDIDEAAIAQLEAQGLIVEAIGSAERSSREALRPVLPQRGAFALGEEVGEAPEARPQEPASIELPAAGVQTSWIVRVAGPLLEQTRDAIGRTGAQLVERIPDVGYLAKATPAEAQDLMAVPGVDDVTHGTGATLAPPMLAAMDAQPGGEQAWDVVLADPDDRDRMVRWLEGEGARVVASGGQKVRFACPDTSTVPDRITELAPEAKVSPYIPPVLHNDISRVSLRVTYPTDPRKDIPYRGKGQIVGIADTGIDETHPDFQGRIRAVGLGTPGDPRDPVGHGTHVIGSILGNGEASGGRFRGVAPEATAFVQSLANANGALVGLPLELKDLFQEAYDAGARIHNDSWGARTAGEYTANSIEIDDFVWQHPDMLIVVSAGNDGTSATPVHARPGYVDWVSVGSPASSKNALTVGATRSGRSDGAFSNQTYGTVWPQSFPVPPISAELVSGDPEGIAAFSSRGPCLDERIKPDVVAPGTDILSTRAAGAPTRAFWGEYPADPRYAFMGGTSMATPLVTGCAALVREHFVKDRGVAPSAALLKATLIAGARWLSGTDACADFPHFPNFNQGFGMVDLASTIPNPAEPGLRLVFVDSWQDTAMQFTRTGQRFRFSVVTNGGLPLRICLAYTDAPARSLQNDLSLLVQDPAGTKLVGNEQLPRRLGALDSTNDVEVIRVGTPVAGSYLIQITAKNLLVKPQSFALTVTGDLSSDLVHVPG
jgi:serine protease AprX